MVEGSRAVNGYVSHLYRPGIIAIPTSKGGQVSRLTRRHPRNGKALVFMLSSDLLDTNIFALVSFDKSSTVPPRFREAMKSR